MEEEPSYRAEIEEQASNLSDKMDMSTGDVSESLRRGSSAIRTRAPKGGSVQQEGSQLTGSRFGSRVADPPCLV